MSPAWIRTLQKTDLQAVTRLHMAAFPKSALALLGASVVSRYYQWQMLGPHNGIALGVFQGLTLTGFCFAGVFRGALSGFLQKNRWFLTWRVLIHPWLVFTPFFRERLNHAIAVILHKPIRRISQPALPRKSFGILSIAIDPQFQGLGLGKQLMEETEKIASTRGFVHFHLTVAVDNVQAISLYERMDWIKSPDIDNTWRGLMMKSMSEFGE